MSVIASQCKSPESFGPLAAVVVDGADVLVGTIVANGRRVRLTGIVGAGGDLAGLKITHAQIAGGTHVTLGSDAGLNAQTAAIPFATPADPHLTAANGAFSLPLESGAVEYKVYASKAAGDTTIVLEGSFLED